MSFFVTYSGGLAIAILLLSGLAIADDAALKPVHDCTVLDSQLERLYCYDALFLDSDEAYDNDAPRPAQWHAVVTLEQGRGNDFGFRIQRQGNGDVLMSAPALVTLPPRPRLVISCKDNITRFQLHTDTPLAAKRTELSLITPGKTLQQTWRIRASGHVIGGGRGLPAIATLRQLLHADTLTLASDNSQIDGLRFELGDLVTRIQPLREACHW